MGKYAKNFLTNVIVRVDFLNEIDLDDKIPIEISKQIMEFFPISEPKKLIGRTVKFNPVEKKMEFEGEDSTATEWHFHGKHRTKSLILTSKSFVIIYTVYDSFETLKSEFMSIFKIISDVFTKDLQINRFGLRYVNEINLNESNPMDWKKYINDNLLQAFDFSSDNGVIARLLNNIAFNFDDIILNFNSGMHNPDFPAPIRKKIFVLDYDASYIGLIDFDEIEDSLIRFHSKIEEMFELSIKPPLREIMNDS
ncbi:MAG: TIGR04255 family protein [Methanomethylovorans sp.]|uniref:TIGR04255 family protein n=1 Tax=Methanomethylovorans sp. TaxID=2758717 RepID=UPI0035306F94